MRFGRWAVAAVLLLVVAVAVADAERAPSPPYEFEVTRTATGIDLKCHHGCNWITLTGGCDKRFKSCSFVINEGGIRVLPDPDTPHPGR